MGFRKGLIRSLASLLGIVVGAYGAMFFSGYVEAYLIDWFQWSEQLTNIAAFVLTFSMIFAGVSLLGKLLTKALDIVLLGVFNKILGGLFNVLKYAFLVSLVFMFVNASEEYAILSEEKREESTLYKPVAWLAPAVMPRIMEEFDAYRETEIIPEEDPVEEPSPE